MATQASELGAEAESVIERLDAVPTARPVDRARIESALAEHLQALELDPRPVRWIDAGADQTKPAHDGFIAAWETLWSHNKGRPQLVGMTSTASFKPLYGKGLRKGGLIGTAEKEEKQAGWGVKRQAHKAQKAARDRLEGIVGRVSRHTELARAVEAALGDKGIGRRTTMVQAIGSTSEVQRIRQDTEMNQEIAKGDATDQAAEAAGWFARANALRAAGKPHEAAERVAAAFLPLVAGVEAGLWLFWITDDDVIAVAVPG